MFVVECPKPVSDLSDCTYNGASVSWKVLGAFHTTPRAAGRWSRYQAEVWELAASKGCPGVAIRSDPPVYSGGKAIGAFCVDIAGAADSRPVPSRPTVAVASSKPTYASSATVAPPAIVVSASASAIASSDEEHIVTTVANGVAYFDLGVRNGMHVGSRVDVLGSDGAILTTVQTDLCGEIICRAQLSPTLVAIVKRGMRVRAAKKP